MKKYIRAIEQVKKMSKHYCIFSAQYYPHVGGVERYTLYLSRKLIAAGNEVTIVTSNTGDYQEMKYKKESRFIVCHVTIY